MTDQQPPAQRSAGPDSRLGQSTQPGRPARQAQPRAHADAAADRDRTRSRFTASVEQTRQANAASLVPLTELFRTGSIDGDDRAAADPPAPDRLGADPAKVDPLKHRHAPCGPCPFRRDAPPGAFTPEQFDAMRVTCRSEHGHAALDAPLFGCHPGEPATGDDLTCAGWLAVEGRNSLQVGLAIAFDRLPDTVLDPRPGWPALYSSFEEMVEANRRAAKDG
ncbi:DUF6283 family protein [Nonomuraea sp. NPDC001023]|uniref:DUF6283 family protein n=1 Tax=unclassified Nonomuraea TaxID=2593643 RepID=UPI00331AEB3E